MCQPSPPGSRTTNGSRHVTSVHSRCSSVSYHRASLTRSGRSPTRVHGNQVVGDGCTDALHAATLGVAQTRVEEPAPSVVVEHGGAGPGRQIVPGRLVGVDQRVRPHGPGTEVVGRRVADRCAVVPPIRIVQGARCTEEEQVVRATVVEHPAVQTQGRAAPAQVHDTDRVEDRRLPSMRAADADRERVLEVVRQAHAEGRLSTPEFYERLDGVYLAKTFAELDELVSDLPARRCSRSRYPRRAPAAPPDPVGCSRRCRGSSGRSGSPGPPSSRSTC